MTLLKSQMVLFCSTAFGLNAAVLAVGNMTVGPGQTASVNVALSSAGAQVAAPQFDLSYDKTALTVAVGLGTAANTAGKTLHTKDLVTGQRVILAGGQSAIADGAVASLTITVAANATLGKRTLNLANVVAADPAANAVSMTVTNGGVNVVPALRFVPITPCRVIDTRKSTLGVFGSPSIAGGSSRDFTIPSGACSIPTTAQAYSFNVTVVPPAALGYLTLWPTGQTQPVASTLNSLDGRIKANAAIVQAGTNGAVSVFASNTTDVVIDINGYFVTGNSALAFYPVTPCRVADTRKSSFGSLGSPSLVGGQSRTFAILSSNCNLPSTAQAYSLNFTAVPSAPLGFVTAYPTGQTRPTASNLNDVVATVVANAVIVPAGTSGSVDVFASNNTDLVIDVNGYFAPPGTGGLSLYGVTPCRVLDTRKPAGSPAITSMDLNLNASACALPNTAQAYVFNATVVPPSALGFLTLWPQGQTRPTVSTLNALDAAITSNMAIVPTTNGSISIFGSNPTHVVMDITGYFGQ